MMLMMKATKKRVAVSTFTKCSETEIENRVVIKNWMYELKGFAYPN
jgi:hypothetical protein